MKTVVAIVLALILIVAFSHLGNAQRACPHGQVVAGNYGGQTYCCPRGNRLTKHKGRLYCFNPNAKPRCPESYAGQSIYMGNGTCLVWR